MAATHCLALITPFDPETGQRREVRLSSAQVRAIGGLGKRNWVPAMVKAPSLSMQLFNGDFEQGISPGGARFEVAMKVLTGTPGFENAQRYYWQGADVTLYVGKAGETWPWEIGFRGQVTDFSGDGGSLSLSASVDTDAFAKSVLTKTYAGNGGAEGGEDLTGRAKPLVIGWASNVEPVLVNAVDSIYQFSAYGPIEAVSALYERGSDFGVSAGDFADYSTLQAATVSKGTWATCLAEGLVKLGAPAFGVITGDVKGHAPSGTTPRLTGAIIAVLADLAGIDADRVSLASLAALDSAVPYPINLVLQSDAQFDDLARNLALPCNTQAGFSLTGEFFVTAPDLTKQEALTLHAQGKRMPQVASVKEQNVSRPYARTVFGAARSWRVHSPEEIASEYRLRGPYEATATYRYGDLVTADDGRTFTYNNVAASSGIAPPASPATSNTQWTLFGAADNTASAQITIEPVAVITITASSDNVTTTDLTTVKRRVIVRRGETNVSSLATFTAGTAPGGLAGSFGAGADNNLFTLSQADAAGSFPVGITFEGKTYQTFIEVERIRAAAPVTGGAGSTAQVSDPDWTPIGSATYAQISNDPMQIQSDGAGALEWSLSAAYEGEVGFIAQAKVQYSTDNAAWSDMTGSEVSGSAVDLWGEYPVAGFISGSGTASLTASTDYYVRLVARRSGGTGGCSFRDESFLVKQP